MNKIKFAFFTFIIVLLYIFVYFVTYTFVEPKAYDYMTKHVLTEKLPFDNHKQTYGNDDIVLVMIDAKTNEKYRWPWKREKNCKIFEYLNSYAKPKAIVYDAIITTPDVENPESDKKLFDTVSKIDNLVVGFMPRIKNWDDEKAGQTYDKAFLEKFGVKVVDKVQPTPDLYSSMMAFPKPYFDAIKHTGAVTMLSGFIDGNLNTYARDEVYRNHEYFLRYKDGVLPSLAMSAFLTMNDVGEIELTNSKINFPQINRSISQKSTVYQSITPIKFYKIYSGGYSHKVYSAVDVMDSYDNIQAGKKSIIDPSVFKDKIVVVGANVPAGVGLNDVKNTPVFQNQSGADVQATAIDNIVHNDFLKVTPNSVNILITILGMLCVYSIIRTYSLAKSIFLTVYLILFYAIITAALFYHSIVINVITPIVMFILAMIAAYIRNFVIEHRNKEKVKSTMGKYVSEDVMKRIIENIDNLGLGGKKAVVTVLFSDIRGFTSMSEKMSAQEVSEMLNEYFTEMEPIVRRNNGIINKFIGDAIMAIFGEPINDENHPANAVKCGYEMLLKVEELQKKWEKEGRPQIHIGVGINTGEVFVGNIGSVNRMEYTVIGDTVNLASRLEGYNKIYHTKMLISASTYEEVKDIAEVNKISDVEIRGKEQRVDIYEVVKLK